MDLKTCILDSIPKGKNNRISRVDLFRKLHELGFLVSDRAMRAAIEELRNTTAEGAYICSSLDGGYWIGTFTEVKRYLGTEVRRSNAIRQRARLQLKRVQAHYQQQPLFEVVT